MSWIDDIFNGDSGNETEQNTSWIDDIFSGSESSKNNDYYDNSPSQFSNGETTYDDERVEIPEPAKEEVKEPEYSVQEATEQANGGKSNLQTAISNIFGESEQPQEQPQEQPGKSELQQKFDDANWLQKLGMVARGVDKQAYNQFMGSLSGTAASLLGEGTIADKIYKAIAGQDAVNPVSEWNENKQKRTQYDQQRYGEMVEGNKGWEAANKYGTMAWSQSPSAVLALMVAPISATAGATTAGLQYASSVAQSAGLQRFATIAAHGLGEMVKNPQFILSYSQEAGNAYNGALEDGATPEQASLYAALYGTFSAMIENGGIDEALGGMENYPKAVKDAVKNHDAKTAAVEFAKSIFGEIGEEWQQGGLENLLKRGYGKDVPWYSTEDPNAVINPKQMLETAKDTAITTALLQGGQHAVMSGINAAQNKLYESQMQRQAEAEENAQPVAKEKAPTPDVREQIKEAFGDTGTNTLASKSDSELLNMLQEVVETGKLNGEDISDTNIEKEIRDELASRYNNGIINENNEEGGLTDGTIQTGREGHNREERAPDIPGRSLGSIEGYAGSGQGQNNGSIESQGRTARQTNGREIIHIDGDDGKSYSGITIDGRTFKVEDSTASGFPAIVADSELTPNQKKNVDRIKRFGFNEVHLVRGLIDGKASGKVVALNDGNFAVLLQLNVSSPKVIDTNTRHEMTHMFTRIAERVGGNANIFTEKVEPALRNVLGPITYDNARNKIWQNYLGEIMPYAEGRSFDDVFEELTDREKQAVLICVNDEILSQLMSRDNCYGAWDGSRFDDAIRNPDISDIINSAVKSLNYSPEVMREFDDFYMNPKDDIRNSSDSIPPSDGENTQGTSRNASQQPSGELNSESGESGGGNDNGPWIPPTNQPGSKEPKVSQASTNSMRNTAEQNGATQEDLTYIPKPEKESLNNAMNRVAADKVGEMNKLIEKEMWTGEDIDTAMTIYGQLKYDSVNQHDSKAADTWAKIVQEHATKSGQALQAFAKWARTGKAAQMDIDAMLDENTDLSDEQKQEIKEKVQEFSERYDNIKDENDPDALDNLRKLILEQNEFRKTGTFGNKNFEKLLNKETDFNWLKEYAIRQMRNIPADYTEKPSLGQKLKTWQVNSQLTRVGTFIRNLGGNGTFGIIDTLVQNSFGRVIDNIVSTKTGGRREVTLDKSWLSSKAREAAVRAAERSVLEVAGDVDMTGDPNRYGQTSGRTNKMVGNEAQRFMSRWEQLLGYSLTTSDRFFRGQIEQSITESLMERGMAEAEAKEIARATADYRLFQNNGKAAQLSKTAHDALNKAFSIGKENGEGGFGLGDLLNPYPGVPANLAVKALEYSPLNAIKGFKEIVSVINDANAGKTVPGKQMQAVMDTARGLAGVPIIAMFTALAKSGLFKNSDDEDYDVKAEESAQNLSGIQWNLSATMRALDGEAAEWKDGDNIMKVSWLEPLNAFMSIASLFADSNEDRDLESMASIYLSGALQAAMDMPVMENIQNAVNTFKYAQGDDLLQRLGEAGAQLAGDALGGMIPAPISQTARVTDEYVRDTRGDSKAETAYNAFLNSIPGMRNSLPVKTDNFGNARENEPDMYNRFMNSFVRPGAISTYRETAVQDEIGKLYKETGDVALYPDRNGPKSIKVDGIDYPLSADESRAYHEFVGQKSEEYVQALIDNKAYKTLTTDQKKNAVKEMYELAKGLAKDAYISEQGIKTDTVSDATKLLSGIDKAGTSSDKTALNERNLANYIVYSEAFSNSLKAEDYKETDKLAKWYNDMNENLKTVLLERNTDLKRILEYQKIGLGSETYTKIKTAIPDAQNELDANSTTGSLVRLYGVAKADIPEKDRLAVLEKLVQGDSGFIGSNAKAAVSTLKQYGLSVEQTAQFFDIALHCATYKDTGDAKDFKGKLTPENTAFALMQIPGLTDAQRTAAYNSIRSQVSNYYNDWKNYTYSSEVKWFTNPKNKAAYGTNIKISPQGQNALLASAS